MRYPVVRPIWMRVLLVLSATGFAALFRLSLTPILGERAPFFPFIPFIIVTAWFGGFIDGMATTLFAVFAARYLILRDTERDSVLPSQVTFNIIYVLLGAVISGLVEAMNRARIRAEVAQAELRQAKESLEAASRAKDAFLASLSHELRTPLNPALMTISALEADPATPREIREELGMVQRNIQMEAHLIDDLLDLSRITQGKMSMEFGLMDVHAKIRNSLEICRSDMNSKRLKLTVDVQAKRHWVRGDTARFQQVVWNLVKNAAKFTPEGGCIRVTTSDMEDRRLRIQVIDDGTGIDPEAIPQLFNAFEQGGQETTRRFGGLGLGLAISKAIVDAHGGSISAASEGRGKGATFTVELPDSQFGEEPNHESPGPTPSKPREGIRILLVEDHQVSLRVMTRLLAMQGHDVTPTASVASALEATKDRDFDLLISDVGLPDGTGLDLMAKLRPMKGIALTGFGMDADVRKTREAGFSTHLTKPIGVGQLEMAIAELIP